MSKLTVLVNHDRTLILAVCVDCHKVTEYCDCKNCNCNEELIRNKKMNVTECWNNIAVFEEREAKAWENAKPLQQEARASARMQAYVELMERRFETKV